MRKDIDGSESGKNDEKGRTQSMGQLEEKYMHVHTTKEN